MADVEAIPGYKTTKCIKKEGSGSGVVQARDTVTGEFWDFNQIINCCIDVIDAVHATGVVVETGKKFWSTKDPGTTGKNSRLPTQLILFFFRSAAVYLSGWRRRRDHWVGSGSRSHCQQGVLVVLSDSSHFSRDASE